MKHYYEHPRDEGGKRKLTPLGSNLAEAKRKWAELECQPVPADVRSLSYIFDRYEQEVSPTKAPRTQRDDSERLKQLRPVFGHCLIDSITPQYIRRYLDARTAKVRANREIALFSAIFNKAREWGYTNKPNPVQGVAKNKESGRTLYVTDEMFALVYKNADPIIQDALDLSYLTGQRPADVFKLKWDQIREGAIWLEQRKTKAKLRIELIGELAEVIERIKARGAREVTILTDPKGQPLKPFGYFRSHFDKARDKAEREAQELGISFERFQLRDLRAKAASDLESMSQARKLLGHATENMTRQYVRARVGEKVMPVMAKSLFAKTTDEEGEEALEGPESLEAEVGIEPASTALQAAA